MFRGHEVNNNKTSGESIFRARLNCVPVPICAPICRATTPPTFCPESPKLNINAELNNHHGTCSQEPVPIFSSRSRTIAEIYKPLCAVYTSSWTVASETLEVTNSCPNDRRAATQAHFIFAPLSLHLSSQSRALLER